MVNSIDVVKLTNEDKLFRISMKLKHLAASAYDTSTADDDVAAWGLHFLLDEMAEEIAGIGLDKISLDMENPSVSEKGLTIAGLKTILKGREDNELVKIDGFNISAVDCVPAEAGCPGYLDLTGA